MEAKVKAKIMSLLKIVNVPKSYILEKLDKITKKRLGVAVIIPH